MRAAVSFTLVCVLIGVACAPPAPSEPIRTPLPAPTPARATSPAAVVVTPAAAPSAIPTRAAGSQVPLSLGVQVGRSGSDLRVALILMLQDDAYLGLSVLEAAANTRLDELSAATASLDQNTLAISGIVGAVNGQAAATAVLESWRAANTDLVHYADGGAAQQDAARKDLDMRRATIAGQLAVGAFTSDEAGNVLNSRFQQQLSLADAALAHDESHVLQIARATAASGDDFGRAWAAAIAAREPDQVPPPTEGPDIDVRSNFARLMQERVYLLALAEGAATANRAADTQPTAQAADNNAADIGALMASAYGSDLGSAYTQALRAEGRDLLSAASGGNREQAVSDLDQQRGQLDSMVANQNPIMPPGLLSEELRSVDQSLLAVADAFAARDFVTAYSDLHDAARESQRGADSLSEGIVDRFPIRFMIGTPTAGGGERRTAGRSQR